MKQNAVDRSSLQIRTLVFDLEARGQDDAIPVVVSTDAVVVMPDGPEILIHSLDAVDLSRAPLPIVATHKLGQVNVGVIDGLTIGNGAMRGFARFGTRQEATEYKADVLNRTIRSVSVGYARIKAKMRNDGVLVTNRWMPIHAAMIAEPSDINAGFFRSLDSIPALEITPDAETAVTETREVSDIQPAISATRKELAMTPEEQAAADAAAKALEGKPAVNPVEIEKVRRRGIENLCKANKIDDATRDHWVSSGASMDLVAEQMLGIMEERGRENPQSASKLGLSKKEIKKFSLCRAIDACGSRNWNKAGFEAECSGEISKKLGRLEADQNRFFVPLELQVRENRMPMEDLAYALMKRDLTSGTGSAGGFLVDTANVGFIELLRNRSVVLSMGARRLTGLQGNVAIPKQTVAATAVWLANEASTVTESQQTFAQVALTPKTVGGYTEISRLLLLQSNPSAEGLVMSDLAAVVALAVDLAGLTGSGASGQPTGIINTAGIGGVTGASIAYAGIVEFQTDVATGNALTGSCGYVATPVVAGLLKQRVKFTSTASPIWDGQLLDANVDGYRGMASNQVPTGDLLFGDFGQLVLGEWGVLELEVNPYANFQAGIVGVRALYSIDFGVRIPAAFSLATSVT
jgi:HK97 family phage major capsid protein